MDAMDPMDDEPDLVMVTSDVPLPEPTAQSLVGHRSPSRDSRTARLVPRSKRPIPKGILKKQQEQLMMKPTVVVDEMFPEGAGPYVDIDEVMHLFASEAGA